MTIAGIGRGVNKFAIDDGAIPGGIEVIRWSDVPERSRMFIEVSVGAFAAKVDAHWVPPLGFKTVAINGTDLIVFGRAGGFHGKHGRPAASWVTAEFAAARGREVLSWFAAATMREQEKEAMRASELKIRNGMAAAIA
ncbi:MAG TPA: hypothetical protein VN641_10015 [Urbifossiella sp.]|nr:hypothetical protein [Urbifossiella sp.]